MGYREIEATDVVTLEFCEMTLLSRRSLEETRLRVFVISLRLRYVEIRNLISAHLVNRDLKRSYSFGHI